ASVPEIETWSRRTGDQLGFFITEPNTGDYVLRLRATRKRSSDDVADELRDRVHAIQPTTKLEFGQLVEDVIGDLTTSPEPIEVRLALPAGAAGTDALREARVPVARGRWTRLGDLATVSVVPGETEIARDNQRTQVSVTARLSGRDLGSAVSEIQRLLAHEL